VCVCVCVYNLPKLYNFYYLQLNVKTISFSLGLFIGRTS